MTRADSAALSWDAPKKRRLIRLKVGEEVIRRPAPGKGPDADEAVLRSTAVQLASDEGYQLEPSSVTIAR